MASTPKAGLRRRTTTSALLAVGCLGLGVVAWLQAPAAVERGRSDASASAVRATTQVLIPALEEHEFTGQPIAGADAKVIASDVRDRVLADGEVARVRIWSADGTLVFSSDGADQPAGSASAPAAVRTTAKTERPASVVGDDRLPSSGQAQIGVLGTFVPVSLDAGAAPLAVAEFDQPLASTTGGATVFRVLALVLGALGCLFVWLTVVRRRSEHEEPHDSPVAEIRAGEAPGSGGASEDAAKLQARLERETSARRALESQLEQLRMQIRGGCAELALL